MGTIRVWAVTAAVAVLVLSLVGCAPRAVSGPETSVTATAESTGAAEATDAAEPVESLEGAGEDLTEEAKPAGPELGPTGKDAYTSWAYLKDMYRRDGWWYVVVDYIQVKGPEEELEFVNSNPRLRTFPLKRGARLKLLKPPGGAPEYRNVLAADFKKFQAQPGAEIVEVRASGGYAVQLMQWWAP